MRWVELAVRSLAIYARLDRSAERGRLAVRHAIGGLLAHALRDEELDLLTGALYAAAGPVNEGGLFEWERLWVRADAAAPTCDTATRWSGVWKGSPVASETRLRGDGFRA
jgi:hypothetical protein